MKKPADSLKTQKRRFGSLSVAMTAKDRTQAALGSIDAFEPDESGNGPDFQPPAFPNQQSNEPPPLPFQNNRLTGLALPDRRICSSSPYSTKKRGPLRVPVLPCFFLAWPCLLWLRPGCSVFTSEAVPVFRGWTSWFRASRSRAAQPSCGVPWPSSPVRSSEPESSP